MQPGKTVILCLDTLGDLTLRQPLFSGLLDAGFQVTVVVRRGYETIVPILDRRLEVLVTEVNPYSAPGPETLGCLEGLERQIAERQPEILVSALYDRTYVDDWLLRRFPGKERVGLLNPALGVSPLERWPGLRESVGSLDDTPFEHAVSCGQDDHESQKNNALLGAMTGRLADPYVPTLSPSEEDAARALEALDGLGLQPQRYVFGCPAGTGRTSLKAWPAAAYAELVEHVGRRHGLPVLLTGIASEAPHLAEVAALCRAKERPVQTWVGDSTQLGLLLGLIRNSRLYLGADTGPMHFAGALGVPVVACFGGGHWPRFLPLAQRSFVATQKLPCFGCGWLCWLDEPMCISRVSVQPFKDALDWILSGSPDERRVDTGEALGATAEAVLERARASKRSAVDELNQRLAELDADRQRVIDSIQADRLARQEVIDSLGQQLQAQERLLRPLPVRIVLKLLGWLRVV